MKTIFKFLSILLFAFFLMVSCKKKSEPTPETSNPQVTPTLVAPWKWKEFDDSESGKFFPATSGQESLIFYADGTYSSQFSYYKIGDITASEDDSGTYDRTGDSLIITPKNGKVMRTKVLKLTETELWLIWQRYTSSKVELHFVR